MESRLYLLPFDHRHSFADLIKAKDPLKLKDIQRIKQYKQMVYSAFRRAIANGLSKNQAGILVDETYGENILLDGKKKGFITCYTLERSGQKEFAFDRVDYKKRLKLFRPSYAKVLIRYNPDDRALNKRQARKLSALSIYLNRQKIKFLLEVLVPPTSPQLKIVGSLQQYEQKLRPVLVVKMIKELRSAGVSPQIWKLEGFNTLKDLQAVANVINPGSKIIILGRGENQRKAQQWVSLGAKVKSVIGFAVGRTVFQQPLLDYQNKKINKLQAISNIMNNYLHFVKIFERGKRR